MNPKEDRQPDSSLKGREELCKSLGIASMRELHRLVVDGSRKGIQGLLQRGLKADTLTRLGYHASGMKKLGYGKGDLRRLGYEGGEEPDEPRSAAESSLLPESVRRELEQMITAGCRANELRQRGLTIHHCKTAGYDAREVARLGFSLNELAAEYSLHELRRVGFGVNDLRHLFSGPELRNAGFTATDMRTAGYTIRELLGFGYTENQIRTAGFSNRELVREGISRQLVDKSRAQDW